MKKEKKKAKIIIGNWKMNPQTAEEANKIFSGIARKAGENKKTRTVICPPFVYLSEISKKAKKTNVKTGSQDIFFEEGGSFTGFVSPTMIKNTGADYVIVGHSERRHFGETDELINKKIVSALKNNLIPIVCVGESARNDSGDFLEFIKNQIKSALSGVTKRSVMDIVIAYEPIWAIGAKEAMQPRDVHQMTIYIKKVLSEIYDKTTALFVPVLYGGAVNSENAEAILSEGQADGLLVGRASLDPKDFGEILRIANSL